MNCIHMSSLSFPFTPKQDKIMLLPRTTVSIQMIWDLQLDEEA